MKTLLIVLLFSSSSVSAAPSERLCLLAGQYAGLVAQSRATGTPEKVLLEELKERKRRLELEQVVSLVYTLQLNEADARRVVYLKCQATGFGGGPR